MLARWSRPGMDYVWWCISYFNWLRESRSLPQDKLVCIFYGWEILKNVCQGIISRKNTKANSLYIYMYFCHRLVIIFTRVCCLTVMHKCRKIVVTMCDICIYWCMRSFSHTSFHYDAISLCLRRVLIYSHVQIQCYHLDTGLPFCYILWDGIDSPFLVEFSIILQCLNEVIPGGDWIYTGILAGLWLRGGCYVLWV